MARVGIFLVTVALIGGIVGCGDSDGDGGPYKLYITSTAGGSVTTPGDGWFTYDEATVVNLAAEAEEDYQFLKWTGDVDTIADVNTATTTITVNEQRAEAAYYADYAITAQFGWFKITITQVAAGDLHTVGIKDDGTVVAVGDNFFGSCNVGSWGNITQVAAGDDYTVGLKSDGTVVAAGSHPGFYYWTDIIQVAAGGEHTVGLESDGTVVKAGYYGGYVGGWTNITQVAAGYTHTVGLKSDGTVVAAGWNKYGQCDVGDWTDITQVTAGEGHTVGVKSDGTVVAVGNNGNGQCEVGGWTDIGQVAAGGYHTVGVKSDGTAVAVGANYDGQCNVDGQTLN